MNRALRGDLDWIVLKALAKEPERRYGSATALAETCKRHIEHEPVSAGPPSTAYRLKKPAQAARPRGGGRGGLLTMTTTPKSAVHCIATDNMVLEYSTFQVVAMLPPPYFLYFNQVGGIVRFNTLTAPYGTNAVFKPPTVTLINNTGF